MLLCCAIVFVDTSFYSAMTPLLPGFEEEYGLSKSGAGVLAAAYPAGTLLGALPGGYLAARAGVRATVLLGLALMSVASVAFAFASSIAVLDAARFVQGVGGAASWAGALAWIAGAAPRERRGEMIGTALGAAIAGALVGPVLGALGRRDRRHPGVLRRRRGRRAARGLGAAHAARRAGGDVVAGGAGRRAEGRARRGRDLADRRAGPGVRHDRRPRPAAARRARARRGGDRRGLALRRAARGGRQPGGGARLGPARAALPEPARARVGRRADAALPVAAGAVAARRPRPAGRPEHRACCGRPRWRCSRTAPRRSASPRGSRSR